MALRASAARLGAGLMATTLLALAGLLGALAAPSTAAARAPMTLGMVDDPLFFESPDSVRQAWLGQARSLGASVTRLPVYWAQVAPSEPAPGFSPTNPGDPQYDFSAVDAAVRAASAHGMQVMLMVREAPVWAERSDLPLNLGYNGVWWPDAQKFGEFGRAVALRYSGHFADPLRRGARLPAVHLLQAWNEPNLPSYLSPQWGRDSSGHVVALAPAIYRAMLNSFYAAVKAAVPSDRVFAGATSPYGDAPASGQQRMHPVTFWQELFCLTPSLKPKSCPNPVHLDGLDHHPYTFATTPVVPARNPLDISIVDMSKIARIEAAASRYHRVIPRGPKPLWASEVAWSSPPLTPALQARFLAEGFYELWAQNVAAALWFQIRDDPRHHNSFTGSGLFLFSGQAKPAAAAYRFPFVAVPQRSGQWTVWGRAPRSGSVAIEQLGSGRRWRRIMTVRTGAGNIFSAAARLSRHRSLRAHIGSSISPVWTTTGPY